MENNNYDVQNEILRNNTRRINGTRIARIALGFELVSLLALIFGKIFPTLFFLLLFSPITGFFFAVDALLCRKDQIRTSGRVLAIIALILFVLIVTFVILLIYAAFTAPPKFIGKITP